MKHVQLNKPRLVEGVLHHPDEGPLPYPAATVEAIVAAGDGEEVAEPEPTQTGKAKA